MKRSHLAAVLLLSAFSAQGDVYQCPSDDGSISFTDKPCAGAVEIELDHASAPKSRPLSRYSPKGRAAVERIRSIESAYSKTTQTQRNKSEYDKLMERRDRKNKEKSRRVDASKREASRERRHKELVEALRTPVYVGGYRYRHAPRVIKHRSKFKNGRSRASFGKGRDKK